MDAVNRPGSAGRRSARQGVDEGEVCWCSAPVAYGRCRILASAFGGLGTHFVRGLPRQQFKGIVKHFAGTLAEYTVALVRNRFALEAVRALVPAKLLVRSG